MTFEQSFPDNRFVLGGRGRSRRQAIQWTGRRIFKDLTFKGGFIVQNHGGADGFESEVNVHQVAWIAALGKTLPKEASADDHDRQRQ
ncbi:hypothetical protein [Lignipirellula cremea]|uniref:hypothetical protein n=1 Tax=Lignipirellula cremea TaxID=2528010 RepID=UPI0011A10E3E|nr:hypothetical protein [Lignipirellula cremea]